MKPVTHLLGIKKTPDCNLLVGTNDILIRFAEKRLGRPSVHVKEYTEDLAKPETLCRVDVVSHIQVVNEKLLDKMGVWDVSQPLDPNTALVRDILDEAGRLVGIKVDKEVAQGLQWKLFEGSGGIADVDRAILEATQWVQLTPDPKPELPWFNADGWFRLQQVMRELEGYQAYLDGDTSKMALLGTKEARVSKWNLPIPLVKRSLETLILWQKDAINEDSARIILKSIWANRNSQRKSHKPVKGDRK